MKQYLLPFLLLTLVFAGTGLGQKAKSAKLDGIWHVKAENEDGSRDIIWTLKNKDGKLGGTSVDQESSDERTFSRITAEGKKVKLEIDVEQDGVKGVIRVEAAEESPGSLEGKWSVVGDDGTEYMSGDLFAEREVAFAGEWETVAELPNGNKLESVIHMMGKNAALKGKLESDTGEIGIDKLKAKPRSLQLEFDFDMNGQNIECAIEAKAKDDNQLVGEWTVPSPDGKISGKWTATRKQKSLAGKWKVVATIPNADEYHGTLTLVEKDGKYSGQSKGDNTEARELDSAKIDGENVTLEVPFEQGGAMGMITIKAKIQKDGSLKGEWVLTSDDGEELARNDWGASRD